MRDFAVSEHPGVQRQLDRLAALSLPQGRLSLDPVRALLARIGNPHESLPPVLHVAGTNGKGSTCAYLRFILEAQGLRVHAFASPHLVRYNERIRLAGQLIDDDLLADLLKEVLDAAGDVGASFFEVTTAASFLAFARVPADVVVMEVGLGGRLDASNVIVDPAVCGIATLGIDHTAFLGDTLEAIAREKAGIAKPGRPLVTQAYVPSVAAAVADVAARAGAQVFARDAAWSAQVIGDRLHYRDRDLSLDLPLPTLPGAHQADNAALAVAMLRHQGRIHVSSDAMEQGIVAARWPARMQKLGDGPLTALRPGRELWLDGGHNLDAGEALGRYFAGRAPFHLVTAMLANKDPRALMGPLADKLLSVTALTIPGHDAHATDVFREVAQDLELPFTESDDVVAALKNLPPEGDALIAGSLYLAGKVLAANEELPD